jgi:hypothetical protein
MEEEVAALVSRSTFRFIDVDNALIHHLLPGH